ncbi:MAG: GNAT family N-acetyltransferase, partial [Cyanobacteria bacterium QH_9_48_43]
RFPGELKPARIADRRVRIEQAVNCPASFYRYLYREVGSKYNWVDRLNWRDDEIWAHLAQPHISLWIMYYENSPAGYFELKQHSDSSTELAYFGLLPDCMGCGLGKYLLTCAVERAWATGANYIWVHTCTLDHSAAMPNYLKRGFQPFKREKYFS